MPSRISSDCGITVRFLAGDLDRAREIMEPLDDDLEGVYLQDGDLWETVYKEEGADG